MNRARLVLGLVVILVGLFIASMMVSLVRAYTAKPDAPNGGISIMSYFVHVTYAEVVAGLVVGVLVLFGGIALAVLTRIRKPLTTPA